MRGGLRREDAFDAAFAERVLILGEPLCQVVAHEGGGDRTARRDAEPAADHRGAKQGRPVTRQLFPHLKHHAQADLGGMAAEREAFFHRQQDFADAEETDDRDEKVDAAEQLAPAEGHSQLGGNRVHADACEQQAERHRDDRLVLFLPSQPHERAERQQIDREEFRRPELQRKRRDAGRKERDQQHRYQRADEGGRKGRGKRLGSFALLRHRIAVEGRRHRPGLAGDVEKDRGDRAAEQRSPVDARQHHDGRGRVHREGEGQQDRDSVRAAQTRQYADEDSQHQPDHHQREDLPGQQDAEAVHQETESFHELALVTEQGFEGPFWHDDVERDIESDEHGEREHGCREDRLPRSNASDEDHESGDEKETRDVEPEPLHQQAEQQGRDEYLYDAPELRPGNEGFRWLPARQQFLAQAVQAGGCKDNGQIEREIAGLRAGGVPRDAGAPVVKRQQQSEPHQHYRDGYIDGAAAGKRRRVVRRRARIFDDDFDFRLR